MSLTSVLNIAGTGMTAQSIRLNTTASNIANAESASSSVDETYRARKPWFSVLEKEISAKATDVNGFMETDAAMGFLLRWRPESSWKIRLPGQWNINVRKITYS